MNKEHKIKRKIERRLKNRSKHTKLNIELLRKEILGYRFRFTNQTPWNQSYPIQRNFSIAIRTNKTPSEPLEVKNEKQETIHSQQGNNES